MNQENITISQALKYIDKNEFLLPAIQREFVWKHSQIELLFDSIMQGYPIGSLLLWKVVGETKNKYKFYKFIQRFIEKYEIHNPEINTINMPDFKAVLDGQQRLTSLYIGLKGIYGIMPKRKKRVQLADIPLSKLYLNLTKPSKDTINDKIYDFQFLDYASHQKESLSKNLFEVQQILQFQTIEEFNLFLDNQNYRNDSFAYKTLNRLYQVIHIQPLLHYFQEDEQRLDKALNIFIRANSGGSKLSLADLIISITIAHWTKESAREKIYKIADNIEEETGFKITKDFALKTFLVLHSENIKFVVENFTKEKALEFEENWDKIEKTIRTSFRLIQKFGYSSRNLTSINAVIPIITYIYEKDIIEDFDTSIHYQEDREIIKKWLHIVTLKRFFGAQADERLKLMKITIKETLFLESSSKFPISKIFEKVKGTEKSLYFSDDDVNSLLNTQYSNRYAFPILALLYPHLDFANNDFEIDHLHPKINFTEKKLREFRINEVRKVFFKDKKIYNSILNLQLIDKNTNASKQKKALKDWIEENNIDIGKQLIPQKLEFNDFEDFIAERKKILFNKLKEILTI